MKKVIFIAFSDLHINDWSKFNNDNKRTQTHFRVLSLVKDACVKYGCPALFCGDLFHKPENISQNLLNQTLAAFEELDGKGFMVYGISGNHDMNSIVKVNQELKPVSWLTIFSQKFHFLNSIDLSVERFPFITDDGKLEVSVWGVPYIDHNIGINEYIKDLPFKKGHKNILLLHTDYPGAKDTDGSEVGTSENLNLNLLNKFDLVLCGHIHKPQRLSKKTFMIGAPIQQRRTDKNCDMGYWKVYSDMSMTFIPISQDFPQFIDVSSKEEVKEDGNYYTVISGKAAMMENAPVNRITRRISKKRIVRRYLKAKGIDDKKKEGILLDIIKASEDD